MTARWPRSRSSLALVLAGGLLAVVTVSGRAASSSVDCRAAPAGSIDALICGSSLLSALDAEAARLEGLATGSGATSVERDQAGLPPRDRCLQAPAPERCALDWYLARIASLRAASEGARSTTYDPVLLGVTVGAFRDLAEAHDGDVRAEVLGRIDTLWAGVAAAGDPTGSVTIDTRK